MLEFTDLQASCIFKHPYAKPKCKNSVENDSAGLTNYGARER